MGTIFKRKDRKKKYVAKVMVRGKTRYKYFETKEEAKQQVALWENAKSMGIFPDDLREVLQCKQRLNGEATLTDAVDFFLANHPEKKDAPLVQVAVKNFIEWLKSTGRSHEHVRTLSAHLNPFVAEFGERQPSAATTHAFRQWIENLSKRNKSPRTQKNQIGAAKNFLGWAKTQGWIKDVPVIDERLMPREEIKEPEIYTTQEATDFFAVLEDRFPQAIPHFAVCAFLGLRVSEANRLTWDDIDMGNKMLRVRAKKTKLGIARTLDEDIAPRTAFVWLEHYRHVESFNLSKWTDEKIRKAFPMKKNAFRKTFATMLTSLRKNQQETMYATGHTSLTTLKQHYAGAKQARSEAEAYFNILPRAAQSSSSDSSDSSGYSS